MKKAINSVINQDCQGVTHLLVVDGSCYEKKVNEIVSGYADKKIRMLSLPFNTGRNGFNGHRIYAASAYLVDHEYVFFLDEDNWFDTNHVSSIINLIKTKKLDWAYSMRKIYDYDSTYIAEDNCESIGSFPSFSNRPNLVDTSCYGFKRQTLVKVAHCWYHPLGADRYFFHIISQLFPNHRSTGQYTLNYELTKNRMPTSDFFLQGNQHMLKKYDNQLPWLTF